MIMSQSHHGINVLTLYPSEGMFTKDFPVNSRTTYRFSLKVIHNANQSRVTFDKSDI